ncbi:RxLR effector protein [Phytophthora megakarya]|uniref:RxLR effector protein n=1 Tax=Phytophthora megakarya TaxID=4795 RepID=A0A225UIL1_9STRA|nr:RxLR effector protein [Phytophthora megakarya]
MVSPRRVTWRLLVVLTMTLVLICSVTTCLGQTTGKVEIPGKIRSSDANGKAAISMRFLKGGGTGGDRADALVNTEERGFLADKLIHNPILQLGLKLSLKQQRTPVQVLEDFEKHRIPLNENFLLMWLGYVQKYRTKMETIWPDNKYVVEKLQDLVPASQLPDLFNAMKKKTSLRGFANALENVALNSK